MFDFFKKLLKKNEAEISVREIDDVIYWQNAIYAVLTEMNYEDIYVIGGIVKDKKESKNMQKRLLKWWGVNNRQELLDMIESLKEGLHNEHFVQHAIDFQMPKYIHREDFIENELQYAKEGSEELVLFIYDVWQKDRKSKDEPIIGWDLGRAIYLCHAGYVADYFEYTEALDMALEICLTLQSKFNSWDEFFESYLDGCQYWSGEFVSDEDTNVFRRTQIFKKLKEIEDSPYDLDWNLELKRVW